MGTHTRPLPSLRPPLWIISPFLSLRDMMSVVGWGHESLWLGGHPLSYARACFGEGERGSKGAVMGSGGRLGREEWMKR